jgi:hypothetical protein
VSVGAEWSKDHVSAMVLIHSLLLEFNVGKNGDRAGLFRGTSGTLRREGWEECCGYFEISMWYPPPMTIKDRGVGTYEQVLNVPITCW